MASGSLAWGDYDNDNLLDFLITGSTTTQLWRNTGAGFTRVTVPGLAGVGEGAVAWGDYNQDGRLDFLITGMNGGGSTITQLWRNTGSGFVQTPVSGLQGVWLGDVAWADFDKDGDLDFVVTGTRSFSSGPRLTQLWQNTGTGFTRVSTPGWVGLEMSSVAWGDYDNDGWPDLLIMGAKYSMFASEGPTPAEGAVTQLWRNTGSGFENIEIDGLPACYGGNLAWGDFDNDGRLDFIITGESATGKVTQVWRNTGSTFEPLEIPGFAGNLGGTVEWADYNNDGWLDFLVSGGETQATTQLWRNTSGSFALDPSDNVSQVGVPSLAWGDYDRDGRLDYLITGFNGSLEPADQYFSELWRNVGGVGNSPPSTPTGLSVSSDSGITTIQWQPATDDHTPVGGLTYNVRVGTAPGSGDIVSPQADEITGTRRLATAGNAGHGDRYQVQLPPGNYFVSVQAVDNAWASGAFSSEVSFSTLPNLSIQRQGNNLIITWANADSEYQLESTDSLNPANWRPEPGAANPYSVDMSHNVRFFRLRKP